MSLERKGLILLGVGVGATTLAGCAVQAPPTEQATATGTATATEAATPTETSKPGKDTAKLIDNSVLANLQSEGVKETKKQLQDIQEFGNEKFPGQKVDNPTILVGTTKDGTVWGWSFVDVNGKSTVLNSSIKKNGQTDIVYIGKIVYERNLADDSVQYGIKDDDGKFDSIITKSDGFYTIDTGDNGFVKIPDTDPGMSGGKLFKVKDFDAEATLEVLATNKAKETGTATTTATSGTGTPESSETPKAPESTGTATSAPATETSVKTEQSTATVQATETSEAENGPVIENPCFDIDNLFIRNTQGITIGSYKDRQMIVNPDIGIISPEEFKDRIERTVKSRSDKGSGEFVSLRMFRNEERTGMIQFGFDDSQFSKLKPSTFSKLEMINVVKYGEISYQGKTYDKHLFVFTYQDSSGVIMNIGFDDSDFSTTEAYNNTMANLKNKPWGWLGVLKIVDRKKAANYMFESTMDGIGRNDITEEDVEGGISEFSNKIIIALRKGN